METTNKESNKQGERIRKDKHEANNGNTGKKMTKKQKNKKKIEKKKKYNTRGKERER